MSLTDTAVRNAKPIGKTKRIFDGGGLYLEVAPTGGKWWRLKYRFGGKEKRLSLGVYLDVPLKDARERRDEARKLLANEIDPSENRKAKKATNADRAANSFEVVAREWFSKFSPNWSANHANRFGRTLVRPKGAYLSKSTKPTHLMLNTVNRSHSGKSYTRYFVVKLGLTYELSSECHKNTILQTSIQIV